MSREIIVQYFSITLWRDEKRISEEEEKDGVPISFFALLIYCREKINADSTKTMLFRFITFFLSWQNIGEGQNNKEKN